LEFSNIKVVVVDCDGVLTDGIYQIGEKGHISKSFYTRDFYGIEQLMRNDIKVCIITQSHDQVAYNQVMRICDHSIFWNDCYENGMLSLMTEVKNKESAITDNLFEEELTWENIAYIGDAENDFESMKKVLISVCPSDAIFEIKEVASYPSDYPGGKGVVYDFCMYLLRSRKEERR